MLVSPGFHPGAAARFLPEVRNANLVASARAHLGAQVREGTLLTDPGAPRRSPGLYLALLAEVRQPLSGLAVAPPLAAAASGPLLPLAAALRVGRCSRWPPPSGAWTWAAGPTRSDRSREPSTPARRPRAGGTDHRR